MASQSFRQEYILVGPVSEYKVIYGKPGVFLVLMRIPMPWSDVVKRAVNTGQNIKVGKVWTVLLEGIIPFWVRMDPEKADEHRNLLIEQYSQQADKGGLSEEEIHDLGLMLTASRQEDRDLSLIHI